MWNSTQSFSNIFAHVPYVCLAINIFTSKYGFMVPIVIIIQRKCQICFCFKVKWLWLLIIFPSVHLNLMHIKGAVMHLCLMQSVFLSLCLQTRYIGGLVDPKEKVQDSSCLNFLWLKCGKHERPWRCTVLLHYLFEAGCSEFNAFFSTSGRHYWYVIVDTQ